jgi:hypothetical protein
MNAQSTAFEETTSKLIEDNCPSNNHHQRQKTSATIVIPSFFSS